MHQIFTSFNEKYRVLAAVCIASLFEHTSADVEIVVLDTGIMDPTRKKFERWAVRKKRILTFITVKDENYKSFFSEDFKLPADIAYYPKLLAAHYAAKDAEKILYLDADVICLRNPKEIFQLNLEENIIGAVQDIFIKKVSNGIMNYKNLLLQGDEPYFNSGVLLIDVNLWKSRHVLENVLVTVSKNQSSITYYDQYALNVVLYKQWKKLSDCWNEIYIAETSKIVFRHFAGIKPLEYNYTCNNTNLFFKYLMLSPYYFLIWKRIKVRLFLSKLQWKLKYYSNNVFNTSFDTSNLEF